MMEKLYEAKDPSYANCVTELRQEPTYLRLENEIKPVIIKSLSDYGIDRTFPHENINPRDRLTKNKKQKLPDCQFQLCLSKMIEQQTNYHFFQWKYFIKY